MKVRIHQCRHKGWFVPLSWLIRLVQKTKYSHYAIEFNSLAGNTMIVDATHCTVKSQTLQRFVEHYKIIKTFEVEVQYPRDMVCRWFEHYYGTPYATAQLVGIVIKNKKLGWADKKMTCNELILRFLNRFTNAMITGVDTLDLNQTEAEILKIGKEL